MINHFRSSTSLIGQTFDAESGLQMRRIAYPGSDDRLQLEDSIYSGTTGTGIGGGRAAHLKTEIEYLGRLERALG